MRTCGKVRGKPWSKPRGRTGSGINFLENRRRFCYRSRKCKEQGCECRISSHYYHYLSTLAAAVNCSKLPPLFIVHLTCFQQIQRRRRYGASHVWSFSLAHVPFFFFFFVLLLFAFRRHWR